MKAWSLRKRLVAGLLALLALALVLAATASVVLFASFQVRQIDEHLQSPFGASPPSQVLNWLDQACSNTAGASTPELPTSFVIAVFDQSGTLTCQLPVQPQPSPRWAQLDLSELQESAADHSIATVDEADGKPALWRARVLATDSGYLVIAESLAEVRAASRQLALICVFVGLVIMAVAAVAGVALVRLSLRPLTQIEQTARDIAAGDLSRRIDVPPSNTEVGRLATSLNAMLTQIETAFTERDRTEQRLRRFVADASHELRTPLATIRGHAELVRSGVVSGPEDTARALGRIESESVRMSSLVEDLLLLARLDTTRALEQAPVDLLSIAAEVAADARARASQRRVTLRNPVDPPWQDAPPIALGDQAKLRQIITNLVSNALQYTPADTPIELEVGVLDGRVRLSVIDHGQGLRPGNEERVFERFFREDPGRGRGVGGAGLGLAIASTLAAKHGGTLSYRATEGGGSTFWLELPAEAS